MTLLQLKYISTVAKCGSFSKAAQALYVSQPGISKMVCALEEELGITIFVRSAAGITLTAEGRELLNMGERLLTDAEHISQHFSQDLSKTHETLSVSSQHYCFAIDAMMAYQNTYQKESYTYKFLVGQGPEVIQLRGFVHGAGRIVHQQPQPKAHEPCLWRQQPGISPAF